MASSLRDRLKRIQEQKNTDVPDFHKNKIEPVILEGWEPCGYKTLKRVVILDTLLDLNIKLPPSMVILTPDLAGHPLPQIGDFLFFDLETTGLSGGAGTVAFLAAFGRPVKGKKICLTQYLLLDYPGEDDFLENVISELTSKNSIIVSYNGKCFDSQIIKTRCLMNRKDIPKYRHLDLLFPARRLWKSIIQSCSQASVETNILGIDRTDDIPGALAPEIWFEFLKTGGTEKLLGICDHNSADIAGLSSILSAVISIAIDPFDTEKYRYDLERLAVYWRKFLFWNKKLLTEEEMKVMQYEILHNKGKELLQYAADQNYPQASFAYAQEQMINGYFEDGRKRLLEITQNTFPQNIRTRAIRALAIDSERRLKKIEEALEFVEKGLEVADPNTSGYVEFERRKERLILKYSKSGIA